MSSTLEVSRPDDLAERIDQLVTLTETGQSRAHESYLANQALLEDAAGQASGELGRDAIATIKEAGRQDYAAHLATVAAVRLEDRGDHHDADAMQKEVAARREIAADMRGSLNAEPTAPEPPNGDRPRGYFPKGDDMSGANPDIVFEETRESVQPGGNDYSALRQQPAAVALVQEQESRRPANRVAAQELGDQVTGADTTEAALEPIPEPQRPANTEPNATVTMGVTTVPTPGGDMLMTYQQELRHAEHNVAEQIDPPAPESVPQPEALKEEPEQAGTEAAPVQIAELRAMAQETIQPMAAPEQDTAQIDPAAAYVQGVDTYLAAQQEAAGATPLEMAATVAILDDQPTERDIHQAEAVQRDAETSTKRQEVELPGAENRESASEVGTDWAAQARAALASIKAEKSALEDGNEQGTGQEQDGHTAAFRSFGGRD